MECYENKLCVTYDDLCTGDEAVMKYNTLSSLIYRRRVIVARNGKGEGAYALIVWSSLPAKYRQKWISLYGNPEEAIEQAKRAEAERYREDVDARAFYEEYEQCLNGVRTRLSEKLIRLYTVKASVLGMLSEENFEMMASTNKSNNPRPERDIWERTRMRSESLRKAVDHKLPKSYERLKRAVTDFRKRGYVSVISEKVGNSNSQKITEEARSYLIALKRSRTPVYSTDTILEMYNAKAKDRDWKAMKTKRTLTAWYERPEVKPLWYDARMGEMAAHQRYDRKHVTELPMMRDSLWYGDGTKLNLYYRDEAGNIRTTQVYEVVDAYSECLIGYHISDSEDFWAQYHAFRMAVIAAGHRPYEIVHDNQGGHKKLDAQNFFSKIAKQHRPTAPYNGQSKTIENIFGRFQAQVLARRANFTGMNVTTKSERSKPNIEFMEANKHKLPTLAELKADYAAAREEWNSLPHPATGVARAEMYRMSANPDTDKVGEYEMIDMFWMWTDKPVTFTSRGLTVQISGRKYQYEVLTDENMPDLEWRRTNTYRKFFIQYDPADMTSVRLYYKDDAGELRFSAIGQPPIKVHRAQQEQTEEDKAFIRAMQEATARERAERQLAGKEHEFANGTAPEQHGYVTPRQKGLAKKEREQVAKRIRRLGEQHGVLGLGTVELGRSTKEISNMTFGDVETKVVERKVIPLYDTTTPSAEERKRKALAKL